MARLSLAGGRPVIVDGLDRKILAGCAMMLAVFPGVALGATVPTFVAVDAVLGLDDPYGSTGVYGPGVAVIDLDDDDDLDLFVPNDLSGHKLYRNEAGVFVDCASEVGLAFTTELPPPAQRVYATEEDATAMMPCFVDTDNDGDLDFFLTCWNSWNRFFENVDGQYVDRTASSGLGIVGHSATAAWGDYNRDGLLDVYVADWGGQDHLFENRGNNVFSDVSASSGILDGKTSTFPGWSAVWFYHDDDLWPELYVGNDYGLPNFFFENQVGHLVDRAPDFFPELQDPTRTLFDGNATMGQALGDFDHDGDYDLFVANSLVNDLYRREGNVYRDLMEDPVEVAPGGIAAGLKNNDIGWFCDWPDMDNDGWVDLFLVNGYIRMCLYDDPQNPDCSGMGNPEQPNLLWMNEGGTGFTRVTDAAGLRDLRWGKGGAIFDFDADGDLDVFVSNSASISNPQTHGFWRNDTPDAAKGNWLVLRLRGRDQNVEGVNAQVRVTAAGVLHRRDRFFNAGYLSQAPPELHFGLGDASLIDEIEVFWPDGTVDRLTDVPVNQRLTIAQGQSVPALVAPALEAEATDGRVRLRWSVASDSPFDAFLIARHAPSGLGGTVARIEAERGRRDYEWTDESVFDDHEYRYRLVAEAGGQRIQGEEAVVHVRVLVRPTVQPAIPNPFNPKTHLRYRVPAGAGPAWLRIVDLRGRTVVSLGPARVGEWAEAQWNGTDRQGRPVASGSYRFVVESARGSAATPLTLVR